MRSNPLFVSILIVSSALAVTCARDATAASAVEPSRFDGYLNLLGPLEFGLSLGAEYGTNNTISAKVTASNTSIPINSLMRSDGSFWGGGIFVGYGHYYNDEGVAKGFFLRPGLMAVYVHTSYPDTDNVMGQSVSFQHTFDLLYLGPYLDIGYRWLWRNGVFLSLGGAIGAALKVSGKQNASPNSGKQSNAGPPALPYLEGLLELGYRF
jgi:hypothetical protein